MSKIICPECEKSVSIYAKACPNCGFPMSDFLKEHNLTDEDTAWVCPKCGDIECIPSFKRPICEYCNIPVVQTDIPRKVAGNKTIAKNKEQTRDFEKDTANKYGGNQFSEEAYEHRWNEINKQFVYYSKKFDAQQQNQSTSTQQHITQATCPYCKSTNTKKISTVSRAGSILGFGLFSKKLGKEWHCNNCGSDF